jgi:hypothetical protein
MAIYKLHCLDRVSNIFLHDIHNRPLGCIQITNRCTTNPCKFEHPHVKWAFGVHFNGQ